MKRFNLVAILAVFCIVLGCADSLRAEERSESAGLDQVPKTLAVLPFENNSVTDPDLFAPLSKGLSAMLISDLNKSGSALKLIERGKIQALLKEIALSQTGSVDEATAIRAGKILGAQAIAFGSFMVFGKTVRIDTRIINVETSELIMAESILGNIDNFMSLEQALAEKIAVSLKMALIFKIGKAESSINAALYFSKGLDALDRNDRAQARELFKKSIEIDSAYKQQVDNVQGLNQ
ncbi:MAG: CsgG/HfaB family protein [Candidatus Desulfaltia sp.]|nr:CsgG/HfaB family protein [Candidatus Desulfaltia sp.]